MAKRQTQTVRYVGDGSWLMGVPARDLSPEEWERHKPVILSSPQARALYEVPDGDTAVEPTIVAPAEEG